MTTDQELAVEALTRGIVNKIMHTPISTLKTAARDPESTTVIDLVRRLFNLQGDDETKDVVAAKSGRGSGAGDSGAGVSGNRGARN
jgi:glutamyl-tRNA reductase